MEKQYKLVDGQMVELSEDELAQRLAEEEAEKAKDKRPLANGKDLKQYLEAVKIPTFSNTESWDLTEKLLPFFQFLEGGRVNPMDEETLGEALERINNRYSLTLKEADAVVQLIEAWKQDKKFAVIEDSKKNN